MLDEMRTLSEEAARSSITTSCRRPRAGRNRRTAPRSVIPLFVLALLAGAVRAQEEAPRWIWGGFADEFSRPAGERCHFRAVLDLPAAPKEARLVASADNHFRLWIGGKLVLRGDDWASLADADVTRFLVKGRNVIAVTARNDGGPAGLVVELRGTVEGGAPFRLVSDGTWRSAQEAPSGFEAVGFDDHAFVPAKVLGPLGMPPWGPLAPPRPQRFETLPGFEVDEIASGVGSLIALGDDARGGLYASVESDGVIHLADPDGDGRFERDGTAAPGLRAVQGLCVHDGVLFAVGIGPDGPGLFRCVEGKAPERLVAFAGDGGEHGPHGVVVGPDGRLYVVAGNHVTLASTPGPHSPFRLTYEARTLPVMLDPQGHATHVRAPGGFVVSLAPDGTDLRLVATGFRNSYDLAFDRAGALFTYDSDMEWDLGLPWYRPVRLYHVLPGGEYGWRTGSSKWPEGYPDALPPAADAGRGSPTGMVRYEGRAFPARFRGAILGADWSLGRILAFHLRPRGASYIADFETLVSGRPLNVTDLVVLSDGSLLFSTGGRGTRGGVYRLRYRGAPEDELAGPTAPPRLGIGPSTPEVTLLQALGAPDRTVRFMAGRELERRGRDPLQDPRLASLDQVLEAALVAVRIAADRDFRAPDLRSGAEVARATALRDLGLRLALLRRAATGDARANDDALRALRITEIALSIQGVEAASPLAADLLARFPSGDRALDRELAVVLARFEPAGAVESLVKAFEAESSRAERLHFAACLRTMTRGWSPALFERVFPWLLSIQGSGGGQCFDGYVKAIRNDLVKRQDAEVQASAKTLEASAKKSEFVVATSSGAPRRERDRTIELVGRLLESRRRDPAEGARVFRKTCAACHRFADVGSRGGPELTDVGARFGLDDLLVAMIEPSRTISDQYRALDVFTKDDRLLTGLPVGEDGQTLSLLVGTGEVVPIPLAEISERRVAKTSAMPDGLLDGLTLEEIADLVRYLRDGRPVAAHETSPWVPLLDGGLGALGDESSRFDGDPALWKIEGTTLVGSARDLPQSSFLATRARYGDFRVELEVAVDAGNSGLQFRSRRGEAHRLFGYQADLGERYYGSLYEEGGRGMLANAPADLWEPYLSRGGYNHLVVEALGDRLSIELNGVVTVDLRDEATRDGHFGLQLHAGKETRLRVRNYRVRALTAP